MKRIGYFLIITIIIGSLYFFPTSVRADDDADVKETMLLSELGVGERVFDAGWAWEHRMGDNYTREDEEGEDEDAKPVMWIVAGINHYSGGEAGSVAGGAEHVTLITEEVVARHCFDNSTSKRNHWGDSGSPNATLGIRKFLNGSSYSGNDKNTYKITFYNTFSWDFRRGTVSTILPNKDREEVAYTTRDRVFIPSLTELGHRNEHAVNDIGTVFSYFGEAGVKHEGVDLWTRSPFKDGNVAAVRDVPPPVGGREAPNMGSVGIRPALNLRGDVEVAAEPCEVTGAHEILKVPFDPGDVDGDGAVTVADAIMVLRHIVGLVTLDGDMLERADLDGDEDVTVQDAIMILRIVVGLA